MSVNIGPNIITDGLVFYLDAKDINSYVKFSPVNMSTWGVGAGGSTGFSKNGDTNENERLVGTNPMGESDIVWQTSGDTDSNADGGWNTSYYSVDVNYTYRFSVWVKRISETGNGTFYLGTNPAIVKLNNTTQSNPYWHCNPTSTLSKDVWYLYVGHCFYSSYNGTSRHKDSGYYTMTDGRLGNLGGCNIGVDCKWNPSTTTSMHRAYHFYCTDGTTQLQFYDPRMDKCDGTEPSIRHLLTKSPTIWYDLVNNKKCYLDSVIEHDSDLGIFNLSNDGINYNGSITTSSTCTVVIWIKTTEGQALFLQGNSGSRYLGAYRSGNKEYYGGCGTPDFYMDTADTANIYDYIRDGEWHMVEFKNVDFSIGWDQIQFSRYSGYQFGNGSVGSIMVYNRNLTSSESSQLYNSQKSRFGK